jgi:hypothetical protein
MDHVARMPRYDRTRTRSLPQKKFRIIFLRPPLLYRSLLYQLDPRLELLVSSRSFAIPLLCRPSHPLLPQRVFGRFRRIYGIRIRQKYQVKKIVNVVFIARLSLKVNPGHRFAFEAGQFAWINIPAIDPIQWHPFSISSAPEDDLVTFHIKVRPQKNNFSLIFNRIWEKRLGQVN